LYVHGSVRTCVRVRAYVYVCLCVRVRVYVCLCVSIRGCGCAYLCVCVRPPSRNRLNIIYRVTDLELSSSEVYLSFPCFILLLDINVPIFLCEALLSAPDGHPIDVSGKQIPSKRCVQITLHFYAQCINFRLFVFGYQTGGGANLEALVNKDHQGF